MMKKNKNKEKRPSFTLLFVLLLFVILLSAIGIWQFLTIKNLYTGSQEKIESISSALDELVEYSNRAPANADAPKPEIRVEITYPKEFASDSSLEGLLNTIQTENARSLSAINNLLLVFSILVTVVVVAIPIFNYVFIQKEQLQEIREYLLKVKDYSKELEQQKVNYAALERKYKEIEEKTGKELEQLQIYVKQAAIIINILALGNKGDAIEVIEPVSDSPEDRAQALALGARIDFAKDRVEDALKKISEAIRLVATNADYYDTRSFMYFESGEYKKALDDATKAIEHEPKNARNYLRRSLALHALRIFEKALEDETKAISLAPRNPVCYKQRSMTYCSLRKYEDALEDAQEAYEIDSSYRYSLAWALYQNGEYPGALALVEDLPQESRQYLAFRTRAMARVKIELGRNKKIAEEFVNEVKADLQRAIDLNGKYAFGYLRYAEAMLLLKKLPEALGKLNQALKIDKEEPDVYHWFAEYYRAIGDNENAKKYDKLAEEKGYIPEPKK